MSTNETTPQALLLRAADIITARGWHQGDFVNDTGCVCVLGAIRLAIVGTAADASVDEVRQAALDTSGRFNGPGFDAVDLAALALEEYFLEHDMEVWDVSDWNDHYASAPDEVVSVLRAAGGSR